jgi:hypothetical protein
MDKNVLIRQSGGQRLLGRLTCNSQDVTANVKITTIAGHGQD